MKLTVERSLKLASKRSPLEIGGLLCCGVGLWLKGIHKTRTTFTCEKQTRTEKIRINAKVAKFSEHIRIVSANVNGFRSREQEIRKYIENKGKNCILALSDTRLRKETVVRDIVGFTMIRNDRDYGDKTATAGGVAIIFPKTWSCTEIKKRTVEDEFETISAIILPPDKSCPPMKLTCIYNHPGNHFPLNVLIESKDNSFNGSPIGGILVGDLNCPHPSFGSRTMNEFGAKLLQLLNQENMIYFNVQSPTYFSNSTGEQNTLDMVIADPIGSRFVEACYVDDDIGSDHLPVVTCLSCQTETSTSHKVSITKWAKSVDEALVQFTISDDIEESINEINQIFDEARLKCTRPVKQKRKKLPDEIRSNIQLRKALMKNRKVATSEMSRKILTKLYNRVNRRIQQQMRELDEAEMEQLCDKICNSDNTYEMWRTFRKYKNKNKGIDEPDAPLTTPAGVPTSNNEEKCKEFARYLHSVHQTPENPIFDRSFKKEIDEKISSEERNEIGENTIKNISIANLDNLLSHTKANSAPGEDGITYDLIKLCSNSTKQIICNLFNLCLRKNVFPDPWKKAKVRMLPKPGRDKRQASNYRPISLLSCLGKLFERYIYAHLLEELNAKNFLNVNQAGFVKGRSTQEHVFRLAQGVSNGFKRRDCTLALFLDVKAAFDAVWKNGLKHKINQIGLSKQMENLLHSFLDNRTLRVFTDGVWSEVVELLAGTPQGSCISPILYLIYVNDMTDVLNLTRISASQFADDTGLWVTSKSAMAAFDVMQEETAKIEQWCKKWQVTLSPLKSKLVLFTKCPRHKEELVNGRAIKLFKESVTLVNEAEFLGVIFDSRLTWEPQTRKIVERAYQRLNLLRVISATANRTNPIILATLYKSTIRSIFEHSSICLINAAEAHIQKLQLIQNQALRVILNTPSYVTIKDLHDCSGLPMIKSHLTDYARNRISSMKRNSPIIGSVIQEYDVVKHIRENASALDVIAR